MDAVLYCFHIGIVNKGWLQRQLLRLSLRRAADGVPTLHDGGHHAYGEFNLIDSPTNAQERSTSCVLSTPN